MIGSARFSLNKEDAKHIGKVFLWSMASAGITALLALLSATEVEPKYAMVIPMVNALLVTAQRFVQDRQKK